MRGFTLIEMLIVIAIITVLSVLTLISFSGYRQSAVLKLTAESVMSSVAEAKLKASQGKTALVAGNSQLVCFGVLFNQGEAGVTLLQWPYNGADFYDPADVHGILQTGRCKDVKIDDPAVIKEKKLFQEKVTIGKMLVDGSREEKQVYIIFEPPQGKVISSLGNGDKKLTFTLVGSADAEREFSLDLQTANVL